jgi:hypothetical protein
VKSFAQLAVVRRVKAQYIEGLTPELNPAAPTPFHARSTQPSALAP